MTRVETRRIAGPVPLLDHRPSLVWLSPERLLVGFGEALRVPAEAGIERFESAQRSFDAWCGSVEVVDPIGLPGTGPIAFASFTFDPGGAGSVLVVPETVIGKVGGSWFVTTVGSVDPAHLFHPVGTAPVEPDRIRFAGASVPDVVWMEAVAEAIKGLDAGNFEKVVLARDYAVWSKKSFDLGSLLARLHARFPACFTFLVDGLVGASPELLIRRIDDHVESVALAGTAGRSDDPDRDQAIARRLLESPKEALEHELTVRSVESALRGMGVQLVRDATPTLLDLANVRHLATKFQGRLTEPATALTLAGGLHPTAAVGGWPVAEALAAIRRLERMDRGRYAGPVGWTDRAGDGEFAIALRCAEVAEDRARLFAGSGIVPGSLPEEELEETRLKLEAMRSALG